MGVDVHVTEAMKAALVSSEIEAAKKAHGVIDPVIMHVEQGA